MAEIVNSYKTGIKKEVVRALQPVFGATYPDPNYADKVKVTLDFPAVRETFPAVYVTYSEGTVQNVGLGHYDWYVDDLGNPQRASHFNFTGTLNFNIMTLSPFDRDSIAAGIVNTLAFKYDEPFKTFHDELQDSDWVYLQMTTDDIHPGGESTDTPRWGGEDEIIFTSQYRVNCYGEFYTSPSTGGLIQISNVDLYPYDPTISAPPW